MVCNWGTMNYDILYKLAILIQLGGYTNADWAGYKVDRQSTSEIVFVVSLSTDTKGRTTDTKSSYQKTVVEE